MSSVKVQGNASGTGSVILAAPNTNSTRTLNLPDSDGTVGVLASLTANGVLYANGSGQPTSGSALTFDGTNFKTTGYAKAGGFTVAAGTLSVFDAAAGGLYGYYSSGGVLASYSDNSGTLSPLNFDGSYLAWRPAGSEQMRLTSTGLGIGTSSPTTRLTLKAGSNVSALRIVQDNNEAYGYSLQTDSSTGNFVFNRYATSDSALYTISTSGNLGLGVTPSAWGSFTAIEGTSSGNFGIAAKIPYVISNAYFNGSAWAYKTTAAASTYYQNAGNHYWNTAPSGTAGAAISFTQAMTLDASGNLLVGTTSAVTSTKIVASAAGSTAAIMSADSSGSTSFVRILGDATNNPTLNWQTGQALRFSVSTQAFGSFAEVARIDSSGNLLVGTTTAAVNPASGVTITNGGVSTWNIGISHPSGSASGNGYASFTYNGSAIGSITQNGTTGVLYNLTSDYRLKNNPVPVTGAKEFINALQPKTWDWWDGSGKGVGFIAHEFMEVAKYSGNGTKDAVDDDGNPVYQSIQPSSSEVMANLVAYVQEQQAIITALTARIEALEAK